MDVHIGGHKMKLPKKLEDYLNWEFGSGVKTTRDFKKKEFRHLVDTLLKGKENV
jgi:hypothetical protein